MKPCGPRREGVLWWLKSAGAGRRCEKREKDEQHGDERRSSWLNFKSKNKTITKSKNHHDPKWDPTRDHGEASARVAMDKFNTFASRNDR